MRRTSLSLASAVSAVAIGLPLATASAPASADAGKAAPSSFVFGVIGDVPYGAAQVAAFPGWVDQISADPDVRFVAHVGDIKNGSSVCSDEYFDFIRGQLDRFDSPVVLTPGDNEWTDCHRPNNGGYDPYERLDALRSTFFPEPGVTLGARTMKVDAQPSFPENVDWRAARVTFTTAHVVGSNNGMAPWTGAAGPNARQVAEVAARNDANIAQLREAFAQAEQRRDRAVVVFQQADMFDPTFTPTFADVSAFTSWVQALIDESRAFGRPVYLFDGDSHVYNVDRPLAAGSRWLALYGVEGAADNLTRITVDGSSNNTDWLKVQVHRSGPEVLTWEQVPYR
jgi:hypothetical protein